MNPFPVCGTCNDTAALGQRFDWDVLRGLRGSRAARPVDPRSAALVHHERPSTRGAAPHRAPRSATWPSATPPRVFEASIFCCALSKINHLRDT